MFLREETPAKQNRTIGKTTKGIVRQRRGSALQRLLLVDNIKLRYFIFMPQKVLQLGNSILTKRSKSVKLKSIQSIRIKKIVFQLINVMRGIKKISVKHGNGLSAPQIGFNYRIIVIYFDNKFNVLINPMIIKKTKRLCEYSEGCLSFFYLRGLVKRNKKITVVAFNENSEEVQHTFSDKMSSLVLHEIDHLDGILYLDRITNYKKITSIDEYYKNNNDKLKLLKKIINYVTNQH